MDLNVEQLIEKFASLLQNEARTETVVGQPFRLGEFECVPVVKLAMGMGSGGGGGESLKEGKGSGGGAGAGMGITPIGFLVTRGSEISFLSTAKSTGLAKVFEQVPDLISKMMDKRKEGGNGNGGVDVDRESEKGHS